MDIDLLVESFTREPSKGTTFRVEVPCALYLTVKDRDDLAKQLLRMFGDGAFHDVARELAIFGNKNAVLYPGWALESVGIADIMTED